MPLRRGHFRKDLNIREKPPVDSDDLWVPMALSFLQPGALLRVKRHVAGPVEWLFVVGDKDGEFLGIADNSYHDALHAVRRLALSEEEPEAVRPEEFAGVYIGDVEGHL